MLTGATVPASRPFRATLRITPDPAVLLVGDGVPDVLGLDGVSMADATAWVVERVTTRGADGSAVRVRLAKDLPDHAIAHGGSFHLAVHSSACEALGGSFVRAWRGLSRFSKRTSGFGAPHIWTDHFDIATVAEVPGDTRLGTPAPPGAASPPVVTIGFSPGDGGVPVPYFYGTPWPPPAAGLDILPPLPEGARWNTQGWVGALVEEHTLGAVIPGEVDPPVDGFLDVAARACRALLAPAEGRS